MTRKWSRQAAVARPHAGVGDQGRERACEHGTPGCPGPDSRSPELPCSKCFLNGGDRGDA